MVNIPARLCQREATLPTDFPGKERATREGRNVHQKHAECVVLVRQAIIGVFRGEKLNGWGRVKFYSE